MEDLFSWIAFNKQDVPLYSVIIATIATLISFISSVFTGIYSIWRYKKDRADSKEKLEIQKAQYEDSLERERMIRDVDIKCAEERRRICEQPYLVFKGSAYNLPITSDQIILNMKFINKGRGSAYEIAFDTEYVGMTESGEEVKLYRREPIKDPVANIGDMFEVNLEFDESKICLFRIDFSIEFRDCSARKYIQTYRLVIKDFTGNADIVDYSHPQKKVSNCD